MLEAVCAVGKPVVLLLYGPGIFALPWAKERVSAMVQAFMPGEEAGRVVADALDGSVNPGGHLPFTVPHHVGQIPLVYNHRLGYRHHLVFLYHQVYHHRLAFLHPQVCHHLLEYHFLLVCRVYLVLLCL